MSQQTISQGRVSQRKDPDTALELLILVILGLFMVLFGSLLFGINNGRFPYNPDSTYGLFLVTISVQAAALGKTPFGDFSRSWLVLIIGFCGATVGIFGCFIPGISSYFLRILVGLILLGGGLALFAQLWISRQKARTWLRAGGALRHLTIACGLVYALRVILGVRTLVPGTLTNTQTAVILLVFGISIFYLAGCVGRVRRLYPPEQQTRGASRTRMRILQPASLPLPQALLILFGILLILLGGLLVPVSTGALPFSPDGQFGALLTIMAIQATSLGQTPFGQFRRSWAVVAIGLAFAGLGIVAAIVPGVITDALRILVGVVNIAGGAWSLVNQYLGTRRRARSGTATPARVPADVIRLAMNHTAQSCAAIAFGVAALVPGLVPGLILTVILVVYGLLLFDMAFLLSRLAKLSPA